MTTAAAFADRTRGEVAFADPATVPALRVGLVGLGRTGQEVARYVGECRMTDLAWVLRRRSGRGSAQDHGGSDRARPAVYGLSEIDVEDFLDRRPVDVVIDFSSESGVDAYGEAAAARGIAIVSAVSVYAEQRQRRLQSLARSTPVLWSPNITLGINVVLLAAQMFRRIAPDADVQVIEEHFRTKPETSGTALRLALALGVPDEGIHSVRAGGIVGVHEVVFGFPEQTIRLRHEAISRAAFGAGAVFAASHLVGRPPALYRMEDLLAPYFDAAGVRGPDRWEPVSGMRGRIAGGLRAIARRLEPR